MSGIRSENGRRVRCVLTFDLHRNDRPDDLLACADALLVRAIRAVFFVPTDMLSTTEYRDALLRIASDGHELGTHGHLHSRDEMAALNGRGGSGLEFLKRSTDAFSDFFGVPARNFRAPCWCPLCSLALDELAALGYHVDSSSTPQRPPLMSSFPCGFGHLFARRTPYFIRPGLLEIPTSTLVVPLGWPTFCVLRARGTRLLTRALMWECSLRADVVLVAQFHPSDYSPEGPQLPTRHRSWRDFIPRRIGGIEARRWFRTDDRSLVGGVSRGVFSMLTGCAVTSFDATWEEMRSSSAMRRGRHSPRAGGQGTASRGPRDRSTGRTACEQRDYGTSHRT